MKTALNGFAVSMLVISLGLLVNASPPMSPDQVHPCQQVFNEARFGADVPGGDGEAWDEKNYHQFERCITEAGGTFYKDPTDSLNREIPEGDGVAFCTPPLRTPAVVMSYNILPATGRNLHRVAMIQTEYEFRTDAMLVQLAPTLTLEGVSSTQVPQLSQEISATSSSVNHLDVLVALINGYGQPVRLCIAVDN